MLRVILLLWWAWCGRASAGVSVTDWRIHVGYASPQSCTSCHTCYYHHPADNTVGRVPGGCGSGLECSFTAAEAVIPPSTHGGWGVCGGDVYDADAYKYCEGGPYISFDHYSQLCGVEDNIWQDFTFFESYVTADPNTSIGTIRFNYGGMVTGIRLTVFNAAYPNGRDILFRSAGTTGYFDLHEYVVHGTNRFVVTHVHKTSSNCSLYKTFIKFAGDVTGSVTGVRLVDGPSPAAGRLEMSVNGKWGAGCDDGFNNFKAQVVCRSLAYNGGYWDYVGGPSSLQIVLDDVSCDGTEASLNECKLPPIWTINCAFSEGIFIMCDEGPSGCHWADCNIGGCEPGSQHYDSYLCSNSRDNEYCCPSLGGSVVQQRAMQNEADSASQFPAAAEETSNAALLGLISFAVIAPAIVFALYTAVCSQPSSYLPFRTIDRQEEQEDLVIAKAAVISSLSDPSSIDDPKGRHHDAGVIDMENSSASSILICRPSSQVPEFSRRKL